MGHCYHHALSSVRKWGGVADDYIALHSWFDESKSITADFRHRALRHHAEGIFMLERFFGVTITIGTGRVVPVRLIGEQHVIEDLGFVPSFADWVRTIRPEPWMGRAQPIASVSRAGPAPSSACRRCHRRQYASLPRPARDPRCGHSPARSPRAVRSARRRLPVF